MTDYISRYDSLDAEELLFRIPLRKEFLLEQIGRGKRVLDVGCLGGRITRLIQDQNNDVWAVELNPEAARKASSRGIRVKVANAEEGLPFETASFDVVHAGELLGQLYDTRAFLDECRRVLKPGGSLLFTTANINSLDNRIRMLRGGYPSMVGAYPEDHFGQQIRVFNLDKVRELCTQAGLEVEEVRGIPSLRPTYPWMDRVLGLFSSFAPKLSKLIMVRARKSASASGEQSWCENWDAKRALAANE